MWLVIVWSCEITLFILKINRLRGSELIVCLGQRNMWGFDVASVNTFTQDVFLPSEALPAKRWEAERIVPQILSLRSASVVRVSSNCEFSADRPERSVAALHNPACARARRLHRRETFVWLTVFYFPLSSQSSSVNSIGKMHFPSFPGFNLRQKENHFWQEFCT